MTFGKWPKELHYEPDQLRRIERAREIKAEDIIEIDREKLCGVFYGSLKPRSRERYIYYPTIDSCTCGDFVNRRYPCKHMYRLATECGLLPDDCSHFSEEIAIIENYSDITQQLLKTILGVIVKYNTGSVWVEFNEEHTQIISFSPLSSSFISTTSEIVLNNPFIKLAPVELGDCTDRHINELLDIIGNRPTHNLKGNDLISWCKNAIPDIAYYLRNRFMVYVPFYRKTMRMVLQYLVRKFDWDTYRFTGDDCVKKVRYPCGAKFDKSIISLFGDGVNPGKGTSFDCYFPDDEITRLLTLYGHNRCLNGFTAVAE